MGKKPRKHLRAISSDGATPINIEQVPGLDYVVTEAEAAGILGISKDTLRRQFREGQAPARVRMSPSRIGYRLSAIYQFLEAHTEKPGSKRAEA
jgi:predicted DNA-binding transcriptional regulator AlpA